MHSGVATNRDHINGTLNLNVRLHRSGTKFPGAFPRLSCPQPIGCYSLNESRQFQDYASNVSYLNLPHRTEFPLDLNAGIERVQRKGEAAHKYKDIHDFCRYICNHQQELSRPSTDQKKGPNLSYDFVTFRGILRQIMCTPYERRKDYRLMATRLNGTIYLAKVETEADRLERESMTKQQLDMCSWGFKFEQYCTTEDPKKLPDTTSPVNEAKEFDCVFHLTLNGLQVLFAAEMDGIKSNAT
ncbi:decapping nuclease DXO homolog [Drosophila albomicans]|uniref:Decapping nuclease n=1 Tax=Drosophila albomicans TaxID=7291 RepID=A0A6P8ZGA4_DROAB|nr:decapping nuclease DXO homolog [Drosophila albomicans]